MSKRTRGTTKDANRRRERHARSERFRTYTVEKFLSTFGGESNPHIRCTRAGIRAELMGYHGQPGLPLRGVGIEEDCDQYAVTIRPRGLRGQAPRSWVIAEARRRLEVHRPAGVQSWVVTGARR